MSNADTTLLKEKARALAEEGCGYKKIAALLGNAISPYTVRDWLRRWRDEAAGTKKIHSRRRLTTEEIASLREDYKAGVSWQALEEKYRKSKRALKTHLGLTSERDPADRETDVELIKRAIRLFEDGYRTDKISTRLGISQNCAKMWRIAWRTGRLQERVKEIVAKNRLEKANSLIGEKPRTPSETCDNQRIFRFMSRKKRS